MHGIITVTYGGELDPDLFTYLDDQKSGVRQRNPLIVESDDVDNLLVGMLGFLSSPPARVERIHLRRSA
jgi:hypothetical protein